MPKLPVDKSKCTVVGCINAHNSLHRPPASEPLRSAWLNFIFHGNVPTSVGKVLFVCSKHFKDECFSNLRQYQDGFAERLRLNEGSVPSLHGNDEHIKVECRVNANCQGSPLVRHVASQTDPPDFDFPKTRSVSTQLSMKTLQNHIRSTATQVKVTSRDCSVCTVTLPLNSPMLFLQPTLVKKPTKRPRLSLTDGEEGPSGYNTTTLV
ncbi:uncharacterized protein LOC121641608 [Melanotaenia boesemani]|uniref:uncharacterized protein LOC121641608 n=1 Tax=Melanotaenia boesemani TaxID=1250792 RepID=UPI001C04A59E|nr:uncharacterized protein LOC121641608 [Melanotaenia boesemani]XP_041843782.1 uncharacterized protein LOC121641608 [Melanotaenia boesemani]